MHMIKGECGEHYYDNSKYEFCPYCDITFSAGPKIIRCDNNKHHYDSNKYNSCPYCNRENSMKPRLSQIIRCDKDKHYYDSNQYSTCPHCKREKPPTMRPDCIYLPRPNEIEEQDDLKTMKDTYFVGWLVIIEGKQRGRDFRIIPGLNTIGRWKQNTIYINNNDNEIAGEKHCLIEYDKKTSEFYLERGASSTYCNGSSVRGEGKELSLGDTIEIGSTKFRFIPFCNSSFYWEM